jgi:upstream activation factor subunit UAF30
MPRQVKKNSTETAPTIAAATTAPVVIETKAAEAKVTKAKAPKKTVETKTEVKVEATAPVDTTATATATPVEDVEATIIAQSSEFYAKINQLSSMIAGLKSEYKSLEKKWTKELKVAQKLSSKKKRKSGNRAPSGFVKPTRISDELAKFLEKPAGTEMARTDVTRQLNLYIRANSLQDKENGRKINPDSKLQTLLKLKKTDELTYFNLQRYMSPHFTKNTPVVAAAAVVV